MMLKINTWRIDSMKITVQQLRRAVPQTYSLRAQEFVDVFNEWADRFGINTPLRVVHFLP